MRLTLDTDTQVFFYEQEFYVLSNFSAFEIRWKGLNFPTSEHVYHWEGFCTGYDSASRVRRSNVQMATSAHEAFRYAQANKQHRRRDWDAVKVATMREILVAKVEQHEYVKRKLLETGDRELIEHSWRDDFWGWGPRRDGQNMLGRVWMDIRGCLQRGVNP